MSNREIFEFLNNMEEKDIKIFVSIAIEYLVNNYNNNFNGLLFGIRKVHNKLKTRNKGEESC